MQDWAIREKFHFEIFIKIENGSYIGVDIMIWIYWVVIGDYEATTEEGDIKVTVLELGHTQSRYRRFSGTYLYNTISLPISSSNSKVASGKIINPHIQRTLESKRMSSTIIL